jgi:hypothetical protein
MNRILKLHPVLLGLLLWSGTYGVATAVTANTGSDAARDFALVQARATDDLPPRLRRDLPVAVHAAPVSGNRLIADGDLARLLAVSVDQRILGAIRDGVGVIFSMGELGGLHLNLYSRRNPKGPGQRWNLNPAGVGVAAALPQFWSLGGSLDLARSGDGGRQIVFVPQLLLNVDALTGSDNRFQIFMQYANWRPATGEPALDEKVPQITLRLRY